MTPRWARRMLLLTAAREVSWAQAVGTNRWGQSHLRAKDGGIDQTSGSLCAGLCRLEHARLVCGYLSEEPGTARTARRRWVLKEFEQWHCFFRCGNSGLFQKLSFMQCPSLTSVAFILNSPSGKWSSFWTTDWAKLCICPQFPKGWGDS